MTASDTIRRARERLKEATPGPWRWNTHWTLESTDGYRYDTVLEASHEGECACRSSCELSLDIADADRQLMADAPQLIADLLAIIDTHQAKEPTPVTNETMITVLTAEWDGTEDGIDTVHDELGPARYWAMRYTEDDEGRPGADIVEDAYGTHEMYGDTPPVLVHNIEPGSLIGAGHRGEPIVIPPKEKVGHTLTALSLSVSRLEAENAELRQIQRGFVAFIREAEKAMDGADFTEALITSLQAQSEQTQSLAGLPAAGGHLD